MAEHQNKHIRAAIRYAEQMGWSVVKAGPRTHIGEPYFANIGVGTAAAIRVMSTPRNPEAHARDIRRDAERCPHFPSDTWGVLL